MKHIISLKKIQEGDNVTIEILRISPITPNYYIKLYNVSNDEYLKSQDNFFLKDIICRKIRSWKILRYPTVLNLDYFLY